MALPILGGIAAAGGLFSYNRKNFMFDKEQQLKREYQGQDMRIKQFELYREDIRDLVELTVAKMDNYLIVNTLQLSFCVILFTEGKPHPGKWPQRLHWLYSTCNVGAFTYFLLSVWLAMHASIAAHSFGVRLLTQFVRLPVPNKNQLDAARAKAEDYEGLGVTQLLRIPVWKSQLKRLTRAMDTLTQEDGANSDVLSQIDEQDTGAGATSGPQVTGLRHVQLYRELQANWQSYDAYARVCMSMGTNQLLHALGYYCLGMLVAENRAPWPGLCCVVVFTVCSWLLMRLDLYLSRKFLMIAAVLIIASPILTMITITVDSSTAPRAVKDMVGCLTPLVFALHVAWIVFIVRIAKADTVHGVALPTQFRAVTYLDVFGWLGEKEGSNHVSDSGFRLRESSYRPGEGGLSAVEEEPDLGRSGASTDPLLQGSGASSRPGAAPGASGPRFQDEVLGRQVSGSSAASSSRRRGNTTAMRIALINACRKLKERLAEDFQRWDDERVRQLLAADPFTLQAIAQLRDRFDHTCTDLEQAEGDQAGVDLGGGHAGSGGSFDEFGNRRRFDSSVTASSMGNASYPVWLQLEWAAHGRCMELFFSCETGETSWTRPEDPARVSNSLKLEQRLRTFSDKVSALADFVVENAADPPTAAGGGAAAAPGIQWPTDLQPAAAAGASLAPADPTDAREVRQRSLRASRASQAASDTGSLRERIVDAAQALTTENPEGESLAQETRFGGSEAVQLAEHTRLRDTFFAAGAQAGPTFYPQQPSMYGHRDQVGATRRQPGQMPWQTFLQGSIVLTIIWAVGTCWSIFHIFDYDIPLEPAALHGHGHGHGHGGGEGGHSLLADPDSSFTPDLKRTLLSAKKLSRRPKLVYEGEWPHAFFSPRGLACHPGAGSDKLLIAEKYSLYELDLGSTAQVSTLRPALSECLAAAPDFHAAGIQGVSLECSPDRKRQCTAVLFGAAGQGALRCRLAKQPEDSRALSSIDVAEVELTASASLGSQRITVHGTRKWQALAAGSSESFWALTDGALVQMRPRGDSSTGAFSEQSRPLTSTAELVPQLEVPHATASKSTQVHVLAGSGEMGRGEIEYGDGHKGVLLTLDSIGLLRAFPLEGGAPSSWWLPSEDVVRWTGVCATGGNLYLAGIGRNPERTAGIYSVDLKMLSSSFAQIANRASDVTDALVG